MPQSLPRSAEVYAASQRQEIAAALHAASRLWSWMTDDLDGSYARIERDLLATMDLAQRRVTAGALVYIPHVLAETNPAALRRPPEYQYSADAMIGTAGDGLGTDTLAYEAVIHTKVAIGNGSDVATALSFGGKFLITAVGTMLSDTGRTAEKVAAVGRGSTTFVRMLVPPSCGRCVVLAGRVTGSETAFLRHPKCDCRNIPSAESIASDLTVNPAEYLDSLDEKGLARALGSKANAQAYTDGADLNQLINAYRKAGAVRPAQMAGGHAVKVTIEGTAKRAWARKSMTRAGLPRNAPRLMPESIYALATDGAHAQRLLRLYGWIL